MTHEGLRSRYSRGVGEPQFGLLPSHLHIHIPYPAQIYQVQSESRSINKIKSNTYQAGGERGWGALAGAGGSVQAAEAGAIASPVPDTVSLVYQTNPASLCPLFRIFLEEISPSWLILFPGSNQVGQIFVLLPGQASPLASECVGRGSGKAEASIFYLIRHRRPPIWSCQTNIIRNK